jgi:hypothetical protein
VLLKIISRSVDMAGTERVVGCLGGSGTCTLIDCTIDCKVRSAIDLHEIVRSFCGNSIGTYSFPIQKLSSSLSLDVVITSFFCSFVLLLNNLLPHLAISSLPEPAFGPATTD